ncbi:MAG: helix-turn-helix transcriptional regulator [Alphaproteobacteria bacterium]
MLTDTFLVTDHAAEQQSIPRPIALLSRDYRTGGRTGWHSHPRHQLLYAIEGLMTAETRVGTWFVPAGHALWIPAGIAHDTVIHDGVRMRSAYVATDARPDLPTGCRVIAVSDLLRATLLALREEPPLYDAAGRGGHLAALALDEIARAAATPFELPLPRDRRLARLCQALAAEPDSALDIDGWADRAGLSRRTLTRLFRAETGLSFAAWRRRLRLLQAQERAARGEPPARIAAALGYRSPSAFRAMARRELGSVAGL